MWSPPRGANAVTSAPATSHRAAGFTAVREAELRAVLALYGAHPPILLDYRDQELSTADFATLTQDVWRVMVSVRPEVVITFGPSGISGHDDHKTIHRAATAAFHRYRPTAVVAPRLYYVALPPEMAAQFAFHLHPSEMTLSVCLDIAAVKPLKLQGLRMYRSQRDAQELAVLFASDQFSHEWFYQAYPVAPQRRRQHADCGLRSNSRTDWH